MEKFRRITGIACPLTLSNVDTDVIMPMDRLMRLRRGQYGQWAFESLRYRPDGTENPEFVLNRAPYRHASILIAGANFGCGSSREVAVWALMEQGFRCIIAPSFGDIFQGNAYQNGLLPIVLPEPVVAELAELSSSAEPTFSVDLEHCLIVAPDGSEYDFAIDPERREALLEGLDEVAMTLRRLDEIDAHQAVDRRVRPWIYRI